MRRSREEILDWEARWRLPTAVATLAAVALIIGSIFVLSDVSGDGSAEILTKADEHGSSVILSGLLQGLGFLLLGFPLVYLFRAAEARSERVRSQLIGLCVAAPIFLAAAAGMNAVSTDKAADKFVSGEVTANLGKGDASKECGEDRKDEGAQDFAKEYDGGTGPLADCTETKIEDDRAEDALGDESLGQFAYWLRLAGVLSLAISLLYGCLNAMRVGLLTRFWGSLGMALGVAAVLLFFQFTLIWFLYFGLLVAGWIPGGRPPAWAAGEAIPWPTPGEKVAEELQGDNGPATGESREASEPRRKRKQRDEGDPE
jgi:hypothetical protein